MPRALSLLFAVTLVCVFASATVIYQTGFESPTYTAGALTGQDGWFNSTVPTVETGTVFAGTQAVGYNATGVTSQNVEIHALSYSSLTDFPVVIGQMEMLISNSGTEAFWDAISFRGPGPGLPFIAQIVVNSSGNATISNVSTFTGSVPVTLGVWNQYQLTLNFTTQEFTGSVNGAAIGTLPFSTMITGLGQVRFGINAAPGTDSANYDNLSIASVPEPSTLVLFGIGLAGTLALRRARPY